MHWIVLAGGRGKRLNPLTNVMQKCMYPIAGRPFLAYTMDGLVEEVAQAGDQITMVVGHYAEQVQGYFGSGYRGAEVNYVWDHDYNNGTAHGVHCAHCGLRIKGPSVVLLGDVYFAPETLQAVRRAEGDALTYLPINETPEVAASPVSVVDGEVQSISWDFAEGEDHERNAADIGLYRLEEDTRGLIREANRDGEWRLLRALARRLEAGGRVAAVRSSEWIHLGNTPSMLDRLGAVTRRLATAAVDNS